MFDANDIFDSYASDAEVTRFVSWRPYKDKSEVAPFLQLRLARWDSARIFMGDHEITKDALSDDRLRVRDHARY